MIGIYVSSLLLWTLVLWGAISLVSLNKSVDQTAHGEEN